LNADMQNRSKTQLQEFRERVGALVEDDPVLRGSPLLDVAIVAEFEEARGIRSPNPQHAAAKLKKLHEKWVVLPGSDPLGPADLLVSTALTRAIAPTVEDLRQREFGSPDPPFTTVSEAVEWIEQRAAEARSEARRRSADRARASQEIDRLAREAGLDVFVDEPIRLPYQRPDKDHVLYAQTIRGSFANRLAREVRRVAGLTGIPADALTIHVLTGLSPVRPRVWQTATHKLYAATDGSQVVTNEVTIRVLTPDLQRREWNALFEAVRRPLPGRISATDAEIWALVQDLGGPPTSHGSKGPFWQRVLDAYNAAHPDAPRTSTNWVKKSYNRAVAVLTPINPL
jgi:hypothetical protein